MRIESSEELRHGEVRFPVAVVDGRVKITGTPFVRAPAFPPQRSPCSREEEVVLQEESRLSRKCRRHEKRIHSPG